MASMKINQEGLSLIAEFENDFDTAETIKDAELCANHYIKASLTSNQFSAIISFIVFEGIDTFLESDIVEFLNANLPLDAANEFKKYIWRTDIHGKKYADRELAKYRKREKELFLKFELVRKRKTKDVKAI